MTGVVSGVILVDICNIHVTLVTDTLQGAFVMKFHGSILNVLKSEAKIKIAQFLLDHEASMSEREIASVLGVSHMSVNRILREFAQMNLVHYVTVGKAHLWEVNRKSFTYKALAQFFDDLKAGPDPLKELKRTILKYLPKSLIQRVVLFGSIAENKEKPDSDIDLFIMVKSAQDAGTLEEKIEKLSSACLDIFGNRLSPYILTERQLKQRQNLDVIAEVNKGIQIYG